MLKQSFLYRLINQLISRTKCAPTFASSSTTSFTIFFTSKVATGPTATVTSVGTTVYTFVITS